MNKEGISTAGKTAGVMLGIAATIVAVIAFGQRLGAAAQPAVPPTAGPTEPAVSGGTGGDPTPITGGSGGIIQQPNERITVVRSNPIEVKLLSTDPIEREQTIRDLAESTGLSGKEEVTGVKTGKTGTGETIYFTPEGKILTNKQEVFNDFLDKTFTPEVTGVFTKSDTKQVSTLEAVRTGQPVNVTNFLTERPQFFPEAKSDTAFLKRAQALQPTLTVGNPGGSSSAAVPNFSRLAALGVDLSKVDILKVQNPAFLGGIKSGQGPLTTAQKIAIDQERLRIDPRNMTSSDFRAIEANKASAAAASAARTARAAELKTGFNEVKARAFLKSKGFNVQGDLTPQTFANIEAALRKRN